MASASEGAADGGARRAARESDGAPQIALLDAIRAGREYLAGSSAAGGDRLERELKSIAALWEGSDGGGGAATATADVRRGLPPLLERELLSELANLCAALPHAVASSRDAIARSEVRSSFRCCSILLLL